MELNIKNPIFNSKLFSFQKEIQLFYKVLSVFGSFDTCRQFVI